MIRFLFFGLLFYIGYRIIISLVSSKNAQPKKNQQHKIGEETHRDPVCGVYISEQEAVIGRYNGQRYYFCSMGCLEKFREQLDNSSPS